ncbi:MAG: preprotein translocase subunit SecG [Clostridia bacterium]|nr:preprotein translocase subunit SecG [Clostridia bacterium]
MELALNIVLIVCSVALIASVLLQSTKSAGLGGAYGGDTESFTTRGKAASRDKKLQKVTIVTGIAIVLLSIGMLLFRILTD